MEQAQCILRYLSMRVPRLWWERGLSTGRIDKTHASIIRMFSKELSSILHLENDSTIALLIALAFANDPHAEIGLSAIDEGNSIEDYLMRAREKLKERPDLVKIAAMIENESQRDA
ncbi:MAG TPA: hypothetical protein VMT62_11850 [Syntrophorhabdaceae bacterium]|nr:hypothetical protein [Syntrophorhabdaceae bacterium]